VATYDFPRHRIVRISFSYYYDVEEVYQEEKENEKIIYSSSGKFLDFNYMSISHF